MDTRPECVEGIFLSSIKFKRRMATTDNNKIINNMPPSLNEQRLIWIDCEMTGLDPVKHRLVEIACVVTEGDLKVGNSFFNFVFKLNLVFGHLQWVCYSI